MKYKKPIKLLYISLLFFSAYTYASPKATTCPPVSKIYKSKLNHWGTANANFRSYTTSFANSLEKFIGAQWQGATLGHVVCIYKPAGNNVFPVVLNFHQLVYEPIKASMSQNAQWVSARPNHQLYNCQNNNVKNCPFIVRKKPKITNIYQDALNLRKEASNNENNTSDF